MQKDLKPKYSKGQGALVYNKTGTLSDPKFNNFTDSFTYHFTYTNGAGIRCAMQAIPEDHITPYEEKTITIREAFDLATGKPSTTIDDGFKVWVQSIKDEELDILYAFRDKYRPDLLHLKRSGTGITIIVNP